MDGPKGQEIAKANCLIFIYLPKNGRNDLYWVEKSYFEILTSYKSYVLAYQKISNGI